MTNIWEIDENAQEMAEIKGILPSFLLAIAIKLAS